MAQTSKVTVEEVKGFITDATKFKEDWEKIADRSWSEIKRKTKNGKLWSLTPNSTSAKARYPAWYSIFKIRQPLVLSRIGTPIGRDTTQDGNDNVGATGAVCLERLAVSLAKSFDFFEVMQMCRDDFLITNFGVCRAYYEKEDVTQEVKEYLIQVPSEDGTDMTFTDAAGQPIADDTEVQQDDEGYFIEIEQTVDIERESVCLEHLLYRHVYIDPGIKNWKRCKRMAFEEFYSEPEFKQIFGMAAFSNLSMPEEGQPGEEEGKAKRQHIKVFEYWDLYSKECVWLAENGDKFITPKGYLMPGEDDGEDYASSAADENGIYDLHDFFPVPKPLLMNSPTDSFWPIPEYMQLIEVFEDIHNIFGKMVQTTRAIRTRLIYDSSVDGLKEALSELGNTDAIGVTNLAQSLQSAGGDLKAVAQYIPVAELIEALQQWYQSLEQRLNTVYKLSGTSDMLQGLVTDPTQRTFGERQMTEKYALNQLADPQRKMAEFVRDCYQLMCEVAIKNFKDASLDIYIMPRTMTPEDQQRYPAAIQMLKEDPKRFRVELETDSTIALNEQYDKQMRIELVNALTAALEKTSKIAEVSPALVELELHAMKFLIQGFRQGKLFQSEITTAIDNVIKQAQEAAQNAKPPFNKDEVTAQLRKMEMDARTQVDIAKIQSDERIATTKAQEGYAVAQMQNQIAQFGLQIEQGKASAELNLEYQKLSASITEAQSKLANDRDALMVELRKIADKKEVDQYQIMIEQQTKPYELQLEAQKQQIDQMELTLRQRDQNLKAQEQMMVDNHVQVDNKLQEIRLKIDAAALQLDSAKPPPPQPLPDVHIHMPQPQSTSKKVKISRDAMGNMTDFQASDMAELVK